MHGGHTHGLLHRYHVLVWYQNTCYNYYLTRVHHVVCCVYQESALQETGLFHNTFLRIDAQHLYYVAHDTPFFFSLFLLKIFVFPSS